VTPPALTIRQPGVEFILRYGKNVENRTWTTSYRGWLALHASQVAEPLDEEIREAFEIPADLPLGAIVGVARLVEIHHCPAGRSCSPWARPGVYHWRISDPRPLPEPIPARGHLGLWELPSHARRAVNRATRQRP
jgi:hypothetical protein